MSCSSEDSLRLLVRRFDPTSHLSLGLHPGRPAQLRRAQLLPSRAASPRTFPAHTISPTIRRDRRPDVPRHPHLDNPLRNHNTGRMKYIHSQELLDIPEGGTFFSAPPAARRLRHRFPVRVRPISGNRPNGRPDRKFRLSRNEESLRPWAERAIGRPDELLSTRTTSDRAAMGGTDCADNFFPVQSSSPSRRESSPSRVPEVRTHPPPRNTRNLPKPSSSQV